MVIPYVVTFIPTFLLFKQFRVLGGYIPLIAPALFGESFFIFMMRQFFRGVPKELDDAARVDGAGEFRIFWQIMLPLVRPSWFQLGVGDGFYAPVGTRYQCFAHGSESAEILFGVAPSYLPEPASDIAGG